MAEHYSTLRAEETVTSRVDHPALTFSNRPSFTLHAAKPGSALEGGGTSSTGHVFLEINTPGYKGSIGFSPGTDYGSSRDNISYGDREIYKVTSTHRVESSEPRFISMLDNLASQIIGFESGATDPGDYNIIFNNCITFVEKMFEKAGVKLDLATTPGGVADKIASLGRHFKTPLLIDLGGDGVTTLPVEEGVSFDYEGNSDSIATGWAGENSGFLVLDRNNDGIINNGKELFGDRTPLPDGQIATNGVIALAALDSNSDGRIDVNDSVWNDLKIWHDINRNGVSDTNELLSLTDAGLRDIDLSFIRNPEFDVSGNIHEYTSSVTWNDGRVTEIVDVLFKVSDPREGLGLFDFIMQNNTVEIVGSAHVFDEVVA